MLVVVITGPPGAGKSTLATAVHDALGEAGVANALIEVDELDRCYPPLPQDRTMAHLRALAASFREAGHALLFVTATLEDDAYASAVRAAVLGADASATTTARGRATGDVRQDGAGGAAPPDTDDLLLVRLHAEPATLRARIVAREPPGWSGLDVLVDASRTLARSMPSLSGVDLVVDTERRSVDAAAAVVGEAVRARLRRASDRGSPSSLRPPHHPG